MQQANTTRRELAIDGAYNVRDLGGLPAGAGRVVRRGQVYRSGDLGRLTVAGAGALRALGVATVIDLRTTAEVQRRGRFSFEDLGIAYRHRPLLDLSATEPEAQLADLPPDVLDQLYRHLAQQGSGNLALVLTWLAEEPTLPALVHCVAGKDRTGLVAAMVLGLLGVADEDIAADYALSEAALAAFRKRAEEEDADAAAWLSRVPPQLLRARPEAMLDLLNWLRERHGSIEGYVRSIGVSDGTVAALRVRLLEREGEGPPEP
jgi:protein tyrosine/serine phosphatase